MQFPLLKRSMSMYVMAGKAAEAPAYLKEAQEKVKEADGYVIISAEYNHSIPPALTNLMDHFIIPSYKHKPCSLITYSYGPYGGVRAGMQLRAFAGELGLVTPQFMFAIPEVQTAFTEEGVPLKDSMVTGAEKIVKELEWFATALKRHKEEHGVPT